MKYSLAYKIRKGWLQNICLPAGTSMSIKATCISFCKEDKRAVLKKNRIEMNKLLKSLPKTKTYSKETMKSCNLQTTPYYLELVTYDNLQSVITRYFK